MTESKKYSLNKEDLIKILKGFLIAILGAIITFLADLIPQVEFGVYTAIVVAISSTLINAARKFLAERKE
jgi:hypothetical protein